MNFHRSHRGVSGATFTTNFVPDPAPSNNGVFDSSTIIDAPGNVFLAPGKVATLHITDAPTATSTAMVAPAPTPMSTDEKIALAAAGVGVVGIIAWALLK